MLKLLDGAKVQVRRLKLDGRGWRYDEDGAKMDLER